MTPAARVHTTIGGIKVRNRVGQNSLMFELLPVHGSFSMPTITLNILTNSDTSSLFTHLTTFNTIPFIITYSLPTPLF